MKRGHQPHGYTIVEVMIFLLITGVLLTSALLVFNGRRQRTEFTQGVREIEAQLKTVINETASGYYANQGNFSCRFAGGALQIEAATTDTKGTNKGCIFLGKVLQFTEGSDYNAYTVVARQRTSDNTEVTELGNSPAGAMQTLITDLQAAGSVDHYRLPWGITVQKVVVVPGGQNIGAFGLISSLGTYGGSDNTDLQSGNSSLDLIPLSGTDRASSTAKIVEETADMEDNERNPGTIILCLRSGVGGRKAAITLGNNNKLGTEVTLDEAVPQECN